MLMHAYTLGDWMWVAPIVMMALFWGGVYLLVRGAARVGARDDGSAMEILKRRFARGELSPEEFENMRREM